MRIGVTLTCNQSSPEGWTEQAAQTGTGYYEIDEGQSAQSEDSYHAEEEDGPWYPGRAREEFDRRRRGQDQADINEDDDPVLVSELDMCLLRFG